MQVPLVPLVPLETLVLPVPLVPLVPLVSLVQPVLRVVQSFQQVRVRLRSVAQMAPPMAPPLRVLVLLHWVPRRALRLDR